MINEMYKEMTGKGSVIRQFFAYANERAKEVGPENVFNFSIGNPSVPTPQIFTDYMIELLNTKDPVALHGYSPSLGIDSTRAAIAESLNKRFGMNYKSDHIFMATGAAGAIAHAVRCVVTDGDEVLTFAPYFPEYVPYIEGTGAKLTIVPADTETFQINFNEFEKALNPNVQAVLINSPNNPSGIVYSTATIKKLAEILNAKQTEYGHDIYLISDEPYREIVFEGTDSPFISAFYDNSICCYSFSKSVSLPGERMGYVAVNPACKDASLIVLMCGQISRFTGHNCPPSIIQLAIEKILDTTSDLSIYEKNKNILYKELTRIGYHIVEPGGTFYMFPRSLTEDANEFCWRAAKELDLITVPGDSFHCPGHFRISYCVTTDMIERSIPLFEKLYKMYHE
ncbi:MAG: pyridoxal phosphate-dependent aminotransferase [Lachnospiraceae bacterium]|nr:pyridoxal phosphate-dependent aminotransferase [Lachnospiraceae bacterium]